MLCDVCNDIETDKDTGVITCTLFLCDNHNGCLDNIIAELEPCGDDKYHIKCGSTYFLLSTLVEAQRHDQWLYYHPECVYEELEEE